MNSEAAAMLRQSAEGRGRQAESPEGGYGKEQPIDFGFASSLGLFHSIREGKVSGNAYTIGLKLGLGLKASPH